MVFQRFLKYLPVTRGHDDIKVISLKGGFSGGIFYSVNNLAKEVTQSGFRRHLVDRDPQEQMSHAQRILQERENQPQTNNNSSPRSVSFAERIAQENRQNILNAAEESKTSDANQYPVNASTAGRQ